jgi:DNA-binding transcriptional regulator YdaS (Cro superfamily)
MKLALKPENLAQLVFFIRGEKVMLDSDLAMLYGVSTKALNQAFRRNKQRFPSDFAFQLSKEEFHHLRSQIVTTSPGDDQLEVTNCDLKFTWRPPLSPLRLYGTRRCHAIERAAKFASGAAFIVFFCFLPAIIVVWLMVMSVFAALIGGAMSSLHHP